MGSEFSSALNSSEERLRIASSRSTTSFGAAWSRRSRPEPSTIRTREPSLRAKRTTAAAPRLVVPWVPLEDARSLSSVSAKKLSDSLFWSLRIVDSGGDCTDASTFASLGAAPTDGLRVTRMPRPFSAAVSCWAANRGGLPWIAVPWMLARPRSKVRALSGAPRSRSKPKRESGIPRSESKRDSSPRMRPSISVMPVASSSSARSSMLAPAPKKRLMNGLVPKVGSPPPWR